MKRITLISKEDCHLCEETKTVLLQAQKKIMFALEERKITPDSTEFEKYHERIPVVLIDDEFAFQHHVSEAQLLKILSSQNADRKDAQTPR